MKPISTVPRALDTVDVATGEAAQAISQRSDVCAVPAAGVVAEAMVALVLADAALEKFGGDSVAETARNVAAYLDAPRGPVSRRAGAGRAPGRGQVDRRARCWPSGSGWRARDTDDDVERAAGKSRSRDIFVDARRGRVPRAGAQAAVAVALAEHDGVLALGGGAVLDADARELLAGHTVVFLDVEHHRRRAAGRASTATGRCCSATRGPSGSG